VTHSAWIPDPLILRVVWHFQSMLFIVSAATCNLQCTSSMWDSMDSSCACMHNLNPMKPNDGKTADSMCVCQLRGQCASVDDRGASSECKPLIYCSHNSHSLFSYTVILARLELTMGFCCRLWALKRFYCATLATATHAYVPQKRHGKFSPLPLCHGHPVQCTGILCCWLTY